MSKKRKLLEKVLSGSKNIRFDDFVTLLEGFGFTLDRVRGSHHVFSHPDIPALLSIQPKKNGQAKPYQIREFVKFLDRYNLKLDED
jgi:predicted RNA binding protein YcfA (HicA-like mRNA interferase family)